MAENELVIDTDGAAGERRVRLKGPLTIGSAATLRTALLEQLRSGACARLDLGAITEADVSGLQLLCSATRTWRRCGGQLRLESQPDWLREMALAAGLPGETI